MRTATMNRPTTPTILPPAAWQAIATGDPRTPWARAGSLVNWTAYALTGPGRITPAGDVWVTRQGEWFANRPGYGVRPVAHESRADALTSVGWLDTATADDIRGGLYTGGNPVSAVLSDGTRVHVYAGQYIDARVFAGVGVDPAPRLMVELSATVAGRLVGALSHRWPVDVSRVRPWAVVDAGRRVPGVRLTFRPGARIALTPPCLACTVPAGVVCLPSCVFTR